MFSVALFLALPVFRLVDTPNAMLRHAATPLGPILLAVRLESSLTQSHAATKAPRYHDAKAPIIIVPCYERAAIMGDGQSVSHISPTYILAYLLLSE